MAKSDPLPTRLRVTIGGRYWQMQFVRSLPGMYGVTDSPETRNKTIKIRRRLKEDVLLDTIIHELLHAADWDVGEGWIEQIATHTSQVLILAGWRRASREISATESQLADLIRTCLRLSKPHLDQDKWAERTSKEVARVIWILGWRCDPQ